MPEIRAKHADVKAPPVSDAKHSLGIPLIGNADPWGEGVKRVVDISVEPDIAITSYTDCPVDNICKAAVPLAIYSLGEVSLPPQSVIKAKLRSNAVGVLRIEEPAFLTFRGVEACAHEPVEAGYVSEQKSGKVQSGVSCVCGIARVEIENTCTIRIARHAQVFRIANIGPEPDLMVPDDACPVVDHLELVFFFGKRAVTTTYVQTVTERPGVITGCRATSAVTQTVSFEKEGGQAAGISSPAIQAGHTERSHWSRACVGVGRLRIVPKPPKA